MGTTNENSVRQQIIRLEVNESAVFPIERADYIRSMAYRVGKIFGRRHECPTTENQIKVIRIQ